MKLFRIFINKLKISNLLFLIIISILVSTKAPLILNNYKNENTKINESTFINYNSNKSLTFPNKQKNILIFWASWCTPCKLEMSRFNKAIQNNEILKKHVFAMNPYEDSKTIKKFIRKNSLQFNFISVNDDLIRKLNITATPTIVYLDKNKVTYITTGVSPLAILRAKWFLN